jgi:ATP-binding cassette subfamily F protein uup
MVAPLVLSVHDAYVTFGGRPLFDQLSFNIHKNDKICLIGKNGAGKTTLMHLITGTREMDGGRRWQEPGIKIGYLQQEVYPKSHQTVFEYICSALPQDKQNEEHRYMVEMMLEPLELKSADKMDQISGGQLRRAALAHALVEEPDILLLDEPTNHLDLAGIEWLEQFLLSYRGTVLCVSHDKAFLTNISDKVFWLDRGKIKVCPKGFKYFDEWSQLLLEQEERELRNRERALEVEVEWASRGVKARRKRNIRRLENMQKERERLRADQSLFNKTMRKVELEPLEAVMASKVIAEFHKVSKYFNEDNHTKTILEKFNLRIMRGDRIGLLGKNGSGKTSFIRLLLGEIKPDMGKVTLAKTIEASYFDQKRQSLNPTHSLKRTLCPEGGDYIEVVKDKRHVYGYLKDFLFDPKSAEDLVGTLSGGQKNRLMLAKVLANPGNLLILDEPTNDLDMDTLDMLEEILTTYEGTLIVVSHDRDFLDQTVTKVLAFEGEGRVDGYIGGYSDYIAESGKNQISPLTKKVNSTGKNKPASSKEKLSKIARVPKKLSYKLQFEWDNLPILIEKLEQEIKELNHTLSDQDFYQRDPDRFMQASRRLISAQEELVQSEHRWLELDEMRHQL